jgi:hypothetical protein
MNYISNNIKIIKNNNYTKIIANNNINKGSIILIEKPIYSEIDIISLLYTLIKNKDDINIKNLYPRENNINLLNSKNNPYLINLSKIINKYNNKRIKEYLLSININYIYFYYYKILYNAFEMYNCSVILPIGAMMNHSCEPNIIFSEKIINSVKIMQFETIKNIKQGDELYYSYLRNYTGPNNNRKIYLLNHYNFICNCNKCSI